MAEMLGIIQEVRVALSKKSDFLNLALIALLGAAIDSSQTLVILTEHQRSRDAMVVARTAFENIVNICFMCAQGEPIAEQALRHAMQRSYRELLKREIKIKGLTASVQFTGKAEPSEGLKDALAEFTRKDGRERRNWTDKSISDRIQIIHDKYGGTIGQTLLMTLLAIYRDASEVAHGTLFSVMWALGVTGSNLREEQIQKAERRMDLELERSGFLLFLIINCLWASTRVLAQEFAACSELEEKAHKISEEFREGLRYETGARRKNNGGFSARVK